MEAKECLKNIPVGHDDGFAFRNDNKMQLECLKGVRESMSGKQWSICGQWKACMDSEHQQHLKQYLEATVGTTSSGAAENEVCFDPAVDDPEAVQCNCYESALARCTSGESEAECIRKFLVAHCGERKPGEDPTNRKDHQLARSWDQ